LLIQKNKRSDAENKEEKKTCLYLDGEGGLELEDEYHDVIIQFTINFIYLKEN